ncbi:MAG: RNA methyltransferase [Rhodospirillaceae bacterium]
MRGYFGIGVEGITKSYNVGNVFRTAHAFDASFVFTVSAVYQRRPGGHTDTSKAVSQLPFYEFPTIEAMSLPTGCALVGVELDDAAVEVPSFRHPQNAAYVLGSERSGLSKAMIARCDHLIKVPTRVSLNLGIAGVVVMYDRLVSRGRFPGRPVTPGGPTQALPEHVHGGPILRRQQIQQYRTDPPLAELAEVEKGGRED